MNPPSENPDTITIHRPDDWHLHVRDGAMLKTVLPYTARVFARAIIMPNLPDPVTTPAKAGAYRRRILDALPDDGVASRFLPLMTCYLTDETGPAMLAEGFADGVWVAAKLYPAHATTGSAHGVTDPLELGSVYEKMQEIGMPLLIHGEVTDPDVDIFDREAVFIERILTPVIKDFPELRVVLEHITTREGVQFVEGAGNNVAATITAHHLIINRNAMFQGGIRPHRYCLPVAKREEHRLELRRAATSGSPRFFLGTDSAPHAIGDKEADCGCAGIFTAAAAIELYARVFDEEGALENLETFASRAGPDFYGLEPNDERITLARGETPVPKIVEVEGDIAVRPFGAGRTLNWEIRD
ncbi:MAG: dihydroorotase [Rhodospirillales bacterium]|nr:dihydroorotase [Rhodospirillales bacterium]